MKERVEKLRGKSRLLSELILAFFALVVLRCFQLQIIKGGLYSELARRNSIFRIELKAPRGRIYDREGRIIAETRASFSLAIIRAFSRSPTETLSEVSKVINIPTSILLERFHSQKNYPKRKPIVIAENLSMKQVSRIEFIKEKFPELVIMAEPLRYYPYPEILSHVLGYVGEATKREIKELGVEMGDFVGKKGLEREYDKELRGKKGYRMMLRDSLGNPLKLEEEAFPEEGEVIKTSLDFRLQRFIFRKMKGKKGGVVVLNPKTGGVLAMVSSPCFNSNKLSSRFENNYKLKMMNSPQEPLYTRTIQGTYPIGSVFKIAVAIAALKKGIIKPEDRIFCPGFFYFGNRNFKCWRTGGHGWVNLYSAIEKSCNVYFYKVGAKLGIEKLVEAISKFPFGRKTGIDLPNEKSGILPSPQWKEKTLGIPWFPGETISLSIGQGYLTATPLQIALFGAAIANRGWYPQPHFLISHGGKGWKGKVNNTGVDKWIFEAVLKGMRRVVEKGTGKAARVAGVEICGKTGTAQIVALEKTREVKSHSIFLGIAPCKDPQVVISVLIERSGEGGEIAAPMAGDILRYYFNEKIKGN